MNIQEIKNIILLYNKFNSENPITPSFVEHADSDDWANYWNRAAKYIKNKL